MAKMRMDNARNPEQLRRMKALEKSGECHFCIERFQEKHSSPILLETNHWFATANDFPYEGTSHHYLLVSKKHLTRVNELSRSAWNDLFSAIQLLENSIKVKDASLFVRSGNMAITGATLDHLHFHFLSGEEKNEQSEMILVNLGYKKT